MRRCMPYMRCVEPSIIALLTCVDRPSTYLHTTLCYAPSAKVLCVVPLLANTFTQRLK